MSYIINSLAIAVEGIGFDTLAIATQGFIVRVIEPIPIPKRGGGDVSEWEFIDPTKGLEDLIFLPTIDLKPYKKLKKPKVIIYKIITIKVQLINEEKL